MNFARWMRHLCSGQWQVRRTFPAKTLDTIEAAIRQSEQTHDGEIRFAVEPGLDIVSLLKNQSARERALEVFSQLRVWDTRHNNGVLIYLLLADHDVEIIADRGIHAHVGTQGWEAICHAMEVEFRTGRFESGVRAGIQAVGKHLSAHYPKCEGTGEDELSDKPVML